MGHDLASPVRVSYHLLFGKMRGLEEEYTFPLFSTFSMTRQSKIRDKWSYFSIDAARFVHGRRRRADPDDAPGGQAVPCGEEVVFDL